MFKYLSVKTDELVSQSCHHQCDVRSNLQVSFVCSLWSCYVDHQGDPYSPVVEGWLGSDATPDRQSTNQRWRLAHGVRSLRT